jgi:uncharacterized membrane protein YkvI
MKKEFWPAVFQITVTYIGTVVGAGFASGQEIWQFFSKNGTSAIWGIMLTTILFFVFGVYALRLGPRYHVNSFSDLTRILLGSKGGMFINVLLLIVIFGLNIAMIAGGGALIQQIVGWPLYISTLICVWATLLILYFGIRGIIVANSFIVPFMIVWVLFSSVYHLNTMHSLQWVIFSPTTSGNIAIWQSLLAFSYLGFNVGLSLPVLVPLGSLHVDVKVRLLGSLFGSIGLGLLMLLIHLLLVNQRGIHLQEIPLAFIAKTMPIFFQGGVLITIGAEIYSTLIANAFGLASEIAALTNQSFFTWLIILLFAAYGFAQIGFSRIVGWFYPGFGVFGFFILIMIMVQEKRTLNV